VFLIDLLPQGYGREELFRRVGLASTAGIEADWQLLLTGAGNPIGNMRVKEATQWLSMHTGASRGFTGAEVAARGEQFAEYLGQHGCFIAGSSGVQGEWPKLLMTRGDDGLLYLDHTLPDDRARKHYIVKFARGTDPQLATILRHEAPYMLLARLLCLRVHIPLQLHQRALFIPRFDRMVTAEGVIRLAQESIASLTGIPGFGAVPSHDQVCRHLIARCTQPELEILEYLKRDITNLALGNKDNHARNTALQRDFLGNISLTPLYDFAPMYLHSDDIARRIRWENNDDGAPDWTRVVDRVCDIAEETAKSSPVSKGRHRVRLPRVRRQVLVHGMKAMIPALHRIAAEAITLGVDESLHAHLCQGIENQIRRLELLS
jgi:serine/threonine-protein kinase HipA